MKHGSENDKFSPFPYFPQPALGETVYSIFCRCSARSAFKDGHLLQEFTGQRHYTTVLAPLPGYLANVAARMPHGHPWRETTFIVREHTSLPYFTYFDLQKDRDEWVAMLATGESSHPLIMALGLPRSKSIASTPHPRYCPTCVEEDRKAQGFAWFKREHQLPGVAVCWLHETALAQGCSLCGAYPIKGIALSMPGKCSCTDGTSPLPVSATLPAVTQPLLWLARQSAFLVNSSGTTCEKIRENLRQAVLEKGWGRGSLLDPAKLAAGVEMRFGREVLGWLGTPVWINGRPAAWVRRLLSCQNQGERRSSPILFLLIIGTLYNSVEDFEKATANQEHVAVLSTSMPEESPHPAWSNELSHLLQTGDCSLTGIAKCLGVSVYKIVDEARSNRWRVALSSQTRKNLGDEKITAIKGALRNGNEKTGIMRRYGCSEWALTLIELDEPGLNDCYLKAAKSRTLKGNRSRLHQYLATRPTATRSDVMRDLSGLYDALLKNDKEWFYEQMPKKKAVTRGSRKPLVDWEATDRKKQAEVLSIIDNMLDPSGKPVRVTETAVLKQARLQARYRNNPGKYPLVEAIMQTRLESYSEFLKRRITWAVEQMASAGEPISVNKLRRVAAIPGQVLRDQEGVVKEVAQRLNASVDGRSFFA